MRYKEKRTHIPQHRGYSDAKDWKTINEVLARLERGENSSVIAAAMGIKRSRVCLIRNEHGTPIEVKPLKAAKCDKWCFIEDNIELPRWA